MNQSDLIEFSIAEYRIQLISIMQKVQLSTETTHEKSEYKLPVFYMHSFEKGQAQKIIQFLKYDDSNLRSFVLVDITDNRDDRSSNDLSELKTLWDNLAPWPAKKVFRDQKDFTGGAEGYLKVLTDVLIPEIEKRLEEVGITADTSKRGLIGYSMAGLFSLYAASNSCLFSKIGSVSGSLWYDDFERYLKENNINKQVKEVYLSVGDHEDRSREPRIQQVIQKTEAINSYLSTQCEVKYEMNPGSHFQDAEKRMAKGLEYLLIE